MCSTNSHKTWICSECITEPFLSANIEESGSLHDCNYCGMNQACFSLRTICNLTEQAIAEHYVRTSNEPSEFEYAMLRHGDSDYDWEREGTDIAYVIEDLLATSSAVATDIQKQLEEKNYSFEAGTMGEECEFASDSRYEERGKVDTDSLDSMWERFVTSLKTESRYVNHAVSETLNGIFRDVESLQSHENKAVIAQAGPGTEIPFLYRARWCRNHDELESLLVTPDRELGPPPHRLSGSNRMSARGISVFYGASSLEISISEIRPPVGCSVVTARFRITRPLRLLNLPALEGILARGSKFDPSFIRRREQAAFLRTLTRRIVDPVLPGEEDFSYIPTQVIAEYLADPEQFDLDGILYPSVQLSGTAPLSTISSEEDYNVVLFHKASRVRLLTLPAQKDCMIRYGRQVSEDEWEPDICVTEMEDGAAPCLPDTDSVSPPNDYREPSLEIVLSSVNVHEIRAARFEYSTDTVRRGKYSYTPSSKSHLWKTSPGEDDTPY
ncbi:hypothetical protein SM14VA4_50070 (plasmid) [Serratia marcescens]|nr:hypothetical protein SM14VA4_50070 [Serratia marcescens]